jgi:uncharacterized phage-associated protein
MAYKVLDVAKKIISKTDSEKGETISNLKLQKMLYYMQGYFLAYFEKPLFDDEILAWQYGPVVPSVYDKYKSNGAQAISLGDENNTVVTFSEEEEELFDEVYDVYSQFSAIKLMDMTHSEDPWRNTEINKVISKDALKSFFKNKIVD